MGCSEKNDCTSATTSGLVSSFTVSIIRTIVLFGNFSLATVHCRRTASHACSPCQRLAMHRLSRNGAFWVRTSPLNARSTVRSICAASGNSASAYRKRNCSCGVSALRKRAR